MGLYSHIISLINNAVEALTKKLCLCRPVVSISALSTTICEDSSVNLTSSVDQRVTKYQWQYFDGTSWISISGATNPTYTEVLAMGTYTYRLIVGYNTACYGVSNSLVITAIENTVAAYSSADDNEFCNGGSTILHSEIVIGDPAAYCVNPTIQWQVFIPCAGDEELCWQNIPGATSTDYTTPALFTTDGDGDGTFHSYRYLATCQGCSATSDAQTLVVINDPVVTITTEDEEICNGGITVLHSQVIGGAGDNSYQWQEFIDGTWVNIIGANGADYITDVLSTGSYIYRFIVTQDAGCTTTSSSITINVVPDPIVTAEETQSQTPAATACVGGLFEIAGYVTGGSGTNSYQWQYESAPDVWADIFGQNASVFNNLTAGAPFDSVTGTYTFRLQVIQDSGCEAFSNEVVITVQDHPTVTLAADDTTIGVGGQFTLTATPVNDLPGWPITYLMEYWDGGAWIALPVSDPFGFFYALAPDFPFTDMEPITGVAGPLQAGSYDFRISFTQAYGCASIPSNVVTITIS